jgi:hypothetical protein
MAVISQNDFINWKSDPVTKAFFQAAHERIEDAKDVLSVQAGINAEQDNYLRGMVQAYREIQDFRIDDIQETDN